ncbi:hypothetical protein PIB30_044556 [Stylosanthes scabra]|uniref:Uncharacterized protein n=1 Tax=Stylosanthes scabra TaxID=79078 RepID=A0ABU6UEM5_9FABA|nr:hypothetical protein [Stylosanthes scabra]
MIGVTSGGALMNKMSEEAWELIETVADANQHFNRRATSKGVYEVAPSDSIVLAKSLVDIAVMLKEIKEGQQVTPILLKRQLDDSQQYYTQGGREGQPARWIQPQQQHAQPRQPYTYSQP